MAKYIIDVLNTQPDVVQSWGVDPKSVKTIKDGLQFHIEGSKFTGTMTITYMVGLDMLKVKTVSDTDRKDVIAHERVYIDHLVRIIDESEVKTPDYEKCVKSQFPVIIVDSDQSGRS
jgi:hypothetical protein